MNYVKVCVNCVIACEPCVNCTKLCVYYVKVWYDLCQSVCELCHSL